MAPAAAWTTEIATPDWIGWYNNRRLHTACADLAPAELEAAHHRHGGTSRAFVVVSGILTEDTVDGAARLHAQTLGAGAGRRFGPHHVHRITNNGARRAVSLPIYGPALVSMTRYALTDGQLTIAAVERAGDNW
jgi:hypothetical protein